MAMHVTRWPRLRGLTFCARALVAAIAALTMSPAQATPNGHAAHGAPAARGGIAVAGAWNAKATTWTDVSPNLGTLCTGPLALCYWASAVACASKANCMSLGGPDGSQHWNGSTWQSAKAVSAGSGSELRDMSCGGNDCVAVGFRTVSGKRRTLAELWNGSAWSIITTPK